MGKTNIFSDSSCTIHLRCRSNKLYDTKRVGLRYVARLLLVPYQQSCQIGLFQGGISAVLWAYAAAIAVP